jgi:hypothetical protein
VWDGRFLRVSSAPACIAWSRRVARSVRADFFDRFNVEDDPGGTRKRAWRLVLAGPVESCAGDGRRKQGRPDRRADLL